MNSINEGVSSISLVVLNIILIYAKQGFASDVLRSVCLDLHTRSKWD